MATATVIRANFAPETGPRQRQGRLSASCKLSQSQRKVSCSSLRSRINVSDSDFQGTPMIEAKRSFRKLESKSKRRSVVTMVIPFQRGPASKQPPPDIASYIFKHRIIFLGMPFVPAVTELICAELFYLQYEDKTKPIYMYINSTGISKDGEKLGYETEAFALYDLMMFVSNPIYTLAIGNAWGEAALLLSAGAKGNRAALPSAKIMLREPIGRFRGQASDIDIQRREMRHVKDTMLKLYSRHIGKPREELAEDMRRTLYFSPEEAVEYGVIDKVLESPKHTAESVLADFKRRQII